MGKYFFNSSTTTSLYTPSCDRSRIVGSFLTVYFFSGLILNGKLIWIIFKNKKLHTPINYLNSLLAILNLVLTIGEFPLVIANAFNCGFIFGHVGCIILGFWTCFTYYLSVLTLTLISIERYLVICKPFKSYTFNTKRCILSISVCIIISLIWAIAPIIGWSEYSYDNLRITCSMSEDFLNENARSFYITLMVFNFFIPSLILIYAYVSAILAVRKSSRKFDHDRISKLKLKKDSHLMKVAIITITAFFVSYAPYFAVIFTKPFLSLTDREQLMRAYTFAFLIVRSIFIWPALINMVMNKDIKPFVWKNKKVSDSSVANSIRIS